MKSEKYLKVIFIGWTIGLILSSLYFIGFFGSWQTSLSDVLYQEMEPLENIVILSIDDKSLQEIGRWPWPREIFAELFEKLGDAEVVGVDVAFFEDYDSETDERIAEAINKSNARFVMPVEYTKFDDEKGKEVLETISPIKEAAYSLGFINIFTDADGKSRKIPVKIDGENIESYESFSSEIYKAYLNREISYDKEILIINYIGKLGSFREISISDFLYDKEEIDLNGRIVLVGATSPDLHDDYFVPTSYGKSMPGVEVHANALQTMITKKFLSGQSKSSVIILIFLMSIILSFLFSRMKTILMSFSVLAFILIYIFAAIFAFNRGIILNIIYPVFSMLSAYGSTILYNYAIEKRERKKVTETFGKYMSKEVVEEVLKAEKIELKGVEKEITILFADIRGFTALSEKLSPKEVVSMLNHYLGGMTEAVLKNKGTLDKYIGDCIMAVFNSPLRQDDHTIRAVRTALDMQKAVERISKKKEVPKVRCGIGINTGQAVVGNIGSEKRIDYTAIGDSVNLASRLCSVAKANQVIISEETYERIKDNIRAEKLGKVKLKGKEKEVVIYNVLKVL